MFWAPGIPFETNPPVTPQLVRRWLIPAEVRSQSAVEMSEWFSCNPATYGASENADTHA